MNTRSCINFTQKIRLHSYGTEFKPYDENADVNVNWDDEANANVSDGADEKTFAIKLVIIRVDRLY